MWFCNTYATLVFCSAFIFPEATFILTFQYWSHDPLIGIVNAGILCLLKPIIHIITRNSTNINNHDNQHHRYDGTAKIPVVIGLQSAAHCLMDVEEHSAFLSRLLSSREGNKKGRL